MRIIWVTGTTFRNALESARNESQRISGATSAPEELPEDALYYLADDLRSGFGVTIDGTLIALFSMEKGRGETLVRYAIEQGVNNLDCFDGFLPDYYRQFGFVETHREANWTEGEPDVVFMALEV